MGRLPFAFYPDFAILKVFLFPNRNKTLQTVDGFQTGLVGWLAMSRSYYDHDAGLANVQAPDSMLVP